MISMKTRTLCVLFISLMMFGEANAHLMVAQHGTLNVVDDGAFMVLSVPVASFSGVDDDGDGLLSNREFERHRSAIAEAVAARVSLKDPEGPLPLQGLMLSPVVSHNAPDGPASQLIIMGRFALGEHRENLRFEPDFYGKLGQEKSLKITATDKSRGERTVLELSVEQPVGTLFSRK